MGTETQHFHFNTHKSYSRHVLRTVAKFQKLAVFREMWHPWEWSGSVHMYCIEHYTEQTHTRFQIFQSGPILSCTNRHTFCIPPSTRVAVLGRTKRFCQFWFFNSRLCLILRSSSYNGTIVTWTAVRSHASEFKPVLFPVTGFDLSYVANIRIFMILFMTSASCMHNSVI